MPSYSRPSRIVHWLTAALVALLFALGVSMTRMAEGDAKLRVYAWHEWTGLTVFALTVARVWWRVRRPHPSLDLPGVEAVARRLVHELIYALLFIVPVSGWLMTQAFGFSIVYLGVLPLPNVIDEERELATWLQGWHITLAFTLGALAAMHIGAVTRHLVLHGDAVLRRMWPAPGHDSAGGGPRSHG